MSSRIRQWARKAPPAWRAVMRRAAAALTPFPRVYGADFARTYRLLDEATGWSRDRIEAFQGERLQRLVAHACRHVPYYRELFRAQGLTADAIRTPSDLRRLPLLDRETVSARFDDFVTDTADRAHLFLNRTSGPTGTPVRVYLDLPMQVFERAAVWRHWHTAGYRHGQRRATFRGALLGADERGNRVLSWRPAADQLLLSAYDLSDATIASYLDALGHFRPVMIRGYPSNLALLAERMQAAGIALPSVRAVVTSSEKLYAHQRERIETAFGCPVCDWYGHGERVAAVGQCRQGGYHVNPEYGIVEIIDRDGRDAAEGQAGEIVATTLVNCTMPLIRYRTGDVAVPTGRTCSCGWAAPLVEDIEGKHGDVIVTPDGRRISGILVTPVLGGIDAIREWQVNQKETAHIDVNLVLRRPLAPEEERQIEAGLRERLGSDLGIRLHVRDTIVRGPRQKFRLIISELPESQVTPRVG